MIRLDSGQLQAIARAAEAAYPEECCGLLIGRDGGPGEIRVSRVIAAGNTADSDRHRRFEIDPRVLIAVQRSLRGGDERMVGHYHSHPNGAAVPSRDDREMAFDPAHVWLIVAVAAGRVTAIEAFRPNHAMPAGFDPVTLDVVA